MEEEAEREAWMGGEREGWSRNPQVSRGRQEEKTERETPEEIRETGPERDGITKGRKRVHQHCGSSAELHHHLM